MNKEDIIRMALEAGAAMIHGGEHALMGDFALETFFKKAYAAGVAAEREACAKVCDEMASRDTLSNYYKVAANAIRARSNT